MEEIQLPQGFMREELDNDTAVIFNPNLSARRHNHVMGIVFNTEEGGGITGLVVGASNEEPETILLRRHHRETTPNGYVLTINVSEP